MQNFFHADTSKARTVCEKASVAVGAVLALPALLSLMSLIIQTRKWRTEGFLAAGLAIPAICVAVWLAFTFLPFVLYMRNTVKTYKTMHLLRDTEIRRHSQQVRRKNIGGHGRDTTQALYNTV